MLDPTDDRYGDAPDQRAERRFALSMAAAFGFIAAFTTTDLVLDALEGTTLVHVVVEGLLVSVGVFGLATMGMRYRAAARHVAAIRQQAQELGDRLELTRREAERWRNEARELLAGLSSAIDAQFSRWKLTSAERDVALLLLKGLSHKEIAELRQVGEATVRQQAQAVYRKAGVAGRHDLAAFFLEDLLQPQTPPQAP
jgi:DNA-binding CsgD family transcriptional regulator